MRIRSVKPEFWGHPVMGRLDDTTRCLALGLLNLADDEGFFYADPPLIRSALRPFDDDSTTVRRSVETLEKAGWIEVCLSVLHGPIGRVVNFLKHQRVDRPKSSKIKHYWESTTIRRFVADNSSQEQGTGSKEQVSLVEPPPATATALELTGLDAGISGEKKEKGARGADFAAFWEAFPRKVKKKEAAAIWKRLVKAETLPALAVLLAAIAAQRKTRQWLEGAIPHPTTWLNGELWNDETEIRAGRVALPPKPVLAPPEDWPARYRRVMGETLPDGVTWAHLPEHVRKSIRDLPPEGA